MFINLAPELSSSFREINYENDKCISEIITTRHQSVYNIDNRSSKLYCRHDLNVFFIENEYYQSPKRYFHFVKHQE